MAGPVNGSLELSHDTFQISRLMLFMPLSKLPTSVVVIAEVAVKKKETF